MRNCKCDWEGVLEQVTRFVYLGGLITEDGRCEEDVKRRIGLACAAFGGLGKMWRKEHLHRNQNETLLRPGSAILALQLRMLESEERGRAKAASGRDELAEENHRKKFSCNRDVSHH